MNDYERIAAVIRYLDQHQTEQPDLATIAATIGLSPSHFHRLFTEWAGITPKDFLQCLTLNHVKERLRHGESTLDTALEAGLSGPGRLHDLCVGLVSATPGEIKSGGANLAITAGFAQSPFGTCLVAQSPKGICHLSFLDAGDESAHWKQLKEEWPRATLTRSDSEAAGLLAEVFASNAGPDRRRLRAYVRGTPFQVRVWRALLAVPAGHLITYGRLATAIGAAPGAARAIGTAVGQNALAYLIPCHRVIRTTGIIGEYRWGPVRKAAMLAWEGTASVALSPA